MTPDLCLALAIDPALRLLPSAMTSLEARALILAIAAQESALTARRQQPTGPARGYWQFETPSVEEVLTHRATKRHALSLCAALDVEPTVTVVHRALEFHDVLAAAFARLLPWRLTAPLPRRLEPDVAWQQYLKCWKPGKPRPAKWPASYVIGWQTVEGRA